MVETAWASAATFRHTDRRGGANGARIRLLPQKNWAINRPTQLSTVLAVYEEIATQHGASVADFIVLGGVVAIEAATGSAVPFYPGRGDAEQSDTDIASFDVLEPVFDGFRNSVCESIGPVRPEEQLLDHAHRLGLSAPEMTVLIGGLRSFGIGDATFDLWQRDISPLSQVFFTSILDMKTVWKPVNPGLYQGTDRSSGQVLGHASRIDLLFGSHSQLRALAEVYATPSAKDQWVSDFIVAWNKVMNADRFDLLS